MSLLFLRHEYRVFEKLLAGADAQLIIDVPVVILDGVRVDAQKLLNFLPRLAVQIEIKDLMLPGCQAAKVVAEKVIGLGINLLHTGGMQIGKRAFGPFAFPLHVGVFRLQAADFFLMLAILRAKIGEQVIDLGNMGRLMIVLLRLES